MAGLDAGPITSKLQPYRLMRVIPLTRTHRYPPYQETWEQVDFNSHSSYIQELPYVWQGFAVFIEKDNIQPSNGINGN